MGFSRQTIRTIAAMAAVAGCALVGQGVAGTTAQQLPPAARIFGSISINGANAPSGAVVTAFSGSTPCGTSAGSGIYNGTQYFVDIDSTQAPCSGAGSNITFKVNGQNAVETVQVPQVSQAIQQNLTVGGGAASGTVSYATGWNLVGGPSGISFPQANGPLYTFQANDTNYETIPNTQPIVGGQGYWAYFNSPISGTLAGTSAATSTTNVPAGQFVMIGNPSATQTLTVSGADAVDTFDPVANQYVTTSTTLRPGQGAWVFSFNGGAVTLR
jgi:hypothetical protein